MSKSFPTFNLKDFSTDSINAVLYDYSPSGPSRGDVAIPHIVTPEQCHEEVQRGSLYLYVWETYDPESDVDVLVQWWEGWVNNVIPQNKNEFASRIAACFEKFKGGTKPTLAEMKDLFTKAE